MVRRTPERTSTSHGPEKRRFRAAASVFHSVTLAGLALGGALALLARQLLATAVPGLPALDVMSVISTAGVLAAVIAIAAVRPIRRALSVSAATAMSQQQ